jgi:hypothetical protein
MNKVYLLVFDRESNFNYQQLHDFIKNSTFITDWWHYIKSGYLLVSPLSATALADQIRKAFVNHRFLLTKVVLSDSNGWLPKEAWEWVYRNSY